MYQTSLIRELMRLSDEPGGPALLEQKFDDALLGVCTRAGGLHVAAYERSRVIDVLARDMPREDAEEWFEFNIQSAWMGEGTPVFVDTRPFE